MKYKDLKIEKYIDILSSTSPMPGGGVNIGLVGATAIGLAIKVINLSIGKKKYKKYESKNLKIMGKLIEYRKQMLDLMDYDAKCFKEMEKYYKMKKNTERDLVLRKKQYEKASQICIEPAIKCFEICKNADKLVGTLYKKTTIFAESDLKISQILLDASCKSSIENIMINLDGIKSKVIKNKILKTVGAKLASPE